MNERALISVDAAYLWSTVASAAGRQLGSLHGDFQAVAAKVSVLSESLIGVPTWMARWYDSSYEGTRYRPPNQRAVEVSKVTGVRVVMGRTVDMPGPEAKTVQKGVDTALVVDMVLTAANKNVSHIALISGDDDMEPGVRAAQDLGVTVVLLRIVDASGAPMGVSHHLQGAVNRVVDLPVTDLLEALCIPEVPEDDQPVTDRPKRATIAVDCLSFVSMESFLRAVEAVTGKEPSAVALAYVDALLQANNVSQNQTLMRWHEAEAPTLPVRVDHDLMDFAQRAGLDLVTNVRLALRGGFSKAVGLGVPVRLGLSVMQSVSATSAAEGTIR